MNKRVHLDPLVENGVHPGPMIDNGDHSVLVDTSDPSIQGDDRSSGLMEKTNHEEVTWTVKIIELPGTKQW